MPPATLVPSVPPSPVPTLVPTLVPTVAFGEEWEPSPDGIRAARIADGRRLIAVESDGQEKEIVRTVEITGFAWFPDSRHIAYSERVPIQGGFPTGEDRLWIVDAASGSTFQIASGFAPEVSPDGTRIAFMLGSRVGDACIVGFELGVAELGKDLRLSSLLRQDDIQGIPMSDQAETFFPEWHKDVGFPGSWTSASTLEVAMRWACIEDGPGNGIYKIDVTNRTAEKIADLPQD
jgi:hypothetical protein